MGEYESVLMVASGFGIAAFVPYLKKLLYGYNTRAVRAHRVHLVWQIENEVDGLAAEEMLNDALEEDELDDGFILSISVYVRSQTSPKQSLGKRATTYPGQAPLSEIFLAELSGDNVKVQAAEAGGAEDKALGKGGPKRNEQPLDLESGTRWTAVGNKKLLVAVSASDLVRDELREVVGKYTQLGVRFVELDYQPK